MMKTKTFFPVSRLALLALTCVFTLGFAACGGDGDEPTVDELLSKETTPIEFAIEDFDRNDSYSIYDYAGSSYVEKKAVSKSPCTINLRQGKHHLIWIRGLADGVTYDPQDRTLTMSEKGLNASVAFFEKDLEVTPYLMPVQDVKFDDYTCALLGVIVTDSNLNPNKSESHNSIWDGKLAGLPYVKTVSLAGKGYDLGGGFVPVKVFNEDITNGISVFRILTLCPLGGLDDVRLKAEIPDANGNPLPTTAIPKFSLRRGKTTILRGPLFSGSSSDWTVEMK